MRKVLILLAISILIGSTAVAKTTVKKYDKHGSYQGKYVTDGTKTKVYKKNGSYDGYYKQSGNKMKKYKKNGSFEGSYKVD